MRTITVCAIASLLVAFVSINASAQNKSGHKYPVDNQVKLSTLPKEYQELFVKNYLKEVLDGKREAYNYRESKKKISPEEIVKLSKVNDTLYVENPEPPYDLQMKVLSNDKEPLDAITDVMFREYWTIDEKGAIHKRTVAIAPVINYKPLCWIKLDEDAW